MSISLLLAEYILRALVFNEAVESKLINDPAAYAIYPDDPNEGIYSEDFWRLNYIIHKKFNLKHPHPLLGWRGAFDYHFRHLERKNVQNRRPVLLFGDSFAQCIDSTDCFEDFLNNDTVFSKRYYMLNYGVGGFGIDQIGLLMDSVIPLFEDPIVIFSMLTTDLDRAVLKFRDAQKPYYTLTDDELQLKGTPIVLTTDEYIKLHPPKPRSFVLNRVFNIFTRRLGIPIPDPLPVRNEIKKLNKALIKRSIETLNNSGVEFLVLLFQPEQHTEDGWRMRFLMETFDELEVPFFTNVSVKMADRVRRNKPTTAYCIDGDGHPSTYANYIMAKSIKRAVMDATFKDSIVKRQLTRRADSNAIRTEVMSAMIAKDQGWMNEIKRKAEERGISIDSMLILDAQFILSEKDKGNID